MAQTSLTKHWPLASGVERLLPLSFDLARLPIVLSMRYQPDPADPATGRLPDYCYRWRSELREPGGKRKIEVLVTGDSVLGLPYGNDLDVLLAVLFLAVKDEYWDGKFADPSITRIAQFLTREGEDREKDDGPTLLRVQAALQRFANVRISTLSIRRPDQLALELIGGEAQSALIPSGRLIRTETGTDGDDLLEVEWERGIYEGEEKAQVRLGRLQINPLWISHAVAGWASWLNWEKYLEIPDTNPLARRLYVLLAGVAAEAGGTTTSAENEHLWRWNLEELEEAVGYRVKLGPKRRADAMVAAFRLLEPLGVVESASSVKAKRGSYVLRVGPGPELRRSGSLRGATALEGEGQRVMYAIASMVGTEPAQVQRMLAENPGQLYLALQYMAWAREHRPDRVQKAKGYLWNAVLGEKPFDYAKEPEEFHQWRVEEGYATPEVAGVTPTPEAPPAAAAPRPVPLEPDPTRLVSPVPVFQDVAPEALDLWPRVLERLLAQFPRLKPYLNDLAPHSIKERTLVMGCAVSFFQDKVLAHADAFRDLITDASEGQIQELDVRLAEEVEGVWVVREEPAERAGPAQGEEAEHGKNRRPMGQGPLSDVLRDVTRRVLD